MGVAAWPGIGGGACPALLSSLWGWRVTSGHTLARILAPERSPDELANGEGGPLPLDSLPIPHSSKTAIARATLPQLPGSGTSKLAHPADIPSRISYGSLDPESCTFHIFDRPMHSSTPSPNDDRRNELRALLAGAIADMDRVYLEKQRTKRAQSKQATRSARNRPGAAGAQPSSASALGNEPSGAGNAAGAGSPDGVLDAPVTQTSGKREKVLSVRFTQEEWRQLEQRCQGRNKSDYCRALVNGAAMPRIRRSVSNVNKQTYLELGRVANNLNQVARGINAGIKHGFLSMNEELRDYLAWHHQIEETIRQLRLEITGQAGDPEQLP